MGRGALVFKGEDGSSSLKKKKKRSKHKSAAALMPDPLQQPSTTTTPITTQTTARQQKPPQVEEGMGAITTSGTVVTGRNTSFTSQFRVGDAIVVGKDMRVVTMVLSDSSLNLSSAFAQNLKEPTRYSLIAKPRSQSTDTVKDKEKKEEEMKAHAFGSYAGSEVVYRKRTENGNYRIEREGTSANLTRTDLLELRSKKASDKYC